jgi:hypothetical protein
MGVKPPKRGRTPKAVRIDVEKASPTSGHHQHSVSFNPVVVGNVNSTPTMEGNPFRPSFPSPALTPNSQSSLLLMQKLAESSLSLFFFFFFF